jgi:ketosteroid isomerase-like protein
MLNSSVLRGRRAAPEAATSRVRDEDPGVRSQSHARTLVDRRGAVGSLDGTCPAGDRGVRPPRGGVECRAPDRDADALDGLWATDLEVDVPGMAPMTKAEALAFARTGRMRFERYETSQIKVRTCGDTAVVTGRLQRTGTIGDRQRADDWRFTKVYTRQASTWRVVSFHASESPPLP